MPMINVADFKDPNDPAGRSYREVHRAKKHRYPIGTLVELEDGVRLWVVAQTRDCDETPMYELSPDKDDTIPENPGFRNRSWTGGHPEDDMTKVVANAAGERLPAKNV